MSYIGSVDRVYRYMGSGNCGYGVLYAFDEAVVIAWHGKSVGGLWGGFTATPPAPPLALRDLDALPKHSVTPEAVVERNTQTLVVPTVEIKSAVLRRSRLGGAPFRPSVVKFTLVSRKNPRAFYAQRQVTGPVAELLEAVPDGLFENRRPM